jgi:hypothetical protein
LRDAAEHAGMEKPLILAKLSVMGDTDALSQLSRIFNNPKGAFDRETSFVELARLGVPFLADALRTHTDPDVRLAAIRTLGGMTRDNGVNTDVSAFKKGLAVGCTER